MREIKFRAWDRYKKKIIFHGFEIFNEEDNGVHAGYIDNNGNWVQLELMQYTGLKNKNGVEIYEGDIVKIELEINHFTVAYIYFNVFRGKYLVYYFDEDFDEDFDNWENISHFEVIGNIYENPEILHVKE